MFGRATIRRSVSASLIGLFLVGCGDGSTAPDPDPDADITGVTVTATPNPAELTVMVQASASVLPSTAPQTVTWSTSDEVVATVDETGLVTLRLRGEVTITATSTADPSRSGSVTLTVVCPAPRRVDTNITENTTWENWVPDPACFDYVVETSIQTNDAALTIEAGTVIGFEEGTGMRIRIDGSLTAEGTADDPIVLTGTDDERGHWQGLALETAATVENVLTYVTIEYTGGHDISNTENASLIMAGDATARIENSTFQESGGYGIFLSADTEISGGADNRFVQNALGAAYSYGSSVHHLLGGQLLPNDVDFVVLRPNTITEAVMWPSARYHVERVNEQSFHILGGDLTLQPGTELRFEGDQTLLVMTGVLNAVGTPDAPIIFTGTQAVRGHWGGIGFIGAESERNRLESVVVEYGGGRTIGSALERANVLIGSGGVGEHSRVTIAGSVLRGSAEYGLWVQRDNEIPGFEGNLLTDNALGAAWVQAPAAHWLMPSNDFTGNDTDEVAVETGVGMEITEEATWHDLGVPYHLQYHIGSVTEVFGALTIEPGVEMLMAPSLGISMRSGGSMTAEGEEMDRISMRAKSDPWQGLDFLDATGSFDYIDVEDGGSAAWGGVLEAGTVTIRAGQAASIVYFTGEVTLAGEGVGIAFSFGDAIAVGCPGSVFIPPPDVFTDHCRPPTE